MKIFALLLLVAVQHSTAFQRCKSDFCVPLFDNPKTTIYTEQPLKLLGKDEKTGCVCKEKPNGYAVCYNINDKLTPCMEFPRKFRFNVTEFILKTTHIRSIENGDFDNLSHMENLKLEGNQKLERIEPFVFEEMKNLTILSMVFNPALSYLHPDTFRGLVNLVELHLFKNGFHNVEMVAKSLPVKVLPKLKMLNLNENVFKKVSEEAFRAMEGSGLEILRIDSCGIKSIHPKVLEPLKQLADVQIGGNRLELDALRRFLEETLKLGINLQLLDINSSGIRGAAPASLLQVIADSNITYLSLAKNQFDYLDNETFPILMPKLNILDLSDATVRNIDDIVFANLPALKTLKFGKNRIEYFAASKHLSNLTYLDLRETYTTQFFTCKSQFHRMRLQYLDLELTPLVFLTKTDFGDMDNLRILSLKNCNMSRIQDDTFRGLRNLQFMNLEKNSFFKNWLEDHSDIFSGLDNLEVLLMGENEITAITVGSAYLFKHLRHLKHLSLSKNKLQKISRKDFEYLSKLEVLDLSYNQLLAWDVSVFDGGNLKKLYLSNNEIDYLSDAMLRDFGNLTSLEVHSNSFICDCSVLSKMGSERKDKFLGLIEDNLVSCKGHPGRTLNEFLGSVQNATLECETKKVAILIIPLSVVLVIASLMSVLVYIYRWHLRYWSFLVKLYLTRKGKIRNSRRSSGNFQFDAFVSYCNQDRNFVLKAVKMLENQEPYLKLCVYERDFQVGSVISESVLENIEKSRKTLMIVSDAYAKSYWCKWETQIAEHHRLFAEKPDGNYVDESIVVVKLEKVNDAHLSPTLKYLLKTRIYLEWDADLDKQTILWRKLREFLTPPKPEDPQNVHI